MSFLDFRLSSSWERERGIQNLGIKEKRPKVTYLIFRWGSTGEPFFFHGLIDFVLFFFTLAWRTWGPSCLRNSFCHQPGILAMVRLPATNPAQKLAFLLFTSAKGKVSPLPFWGPSQSFGFSLLPLGVRRPEVTKYQHLLIHLCDLHSSLNGHFFFWRLDTVNSTGG